MEKAIHQIMHCHFMNFFIVKEHRNWIICSIRSLLLGDSSYEFFCHTGKQFDERLLELGAKQLSPRVDCDLDYDEPAAEWFSNVQSELNEQ